MTTDHETELSLELGEDVEEARCTCCGRVTRRVAGFIYASGDARAAYIAAWTDGHRDLGADMVIGLGEWGGEPPEQRIAVALTWRAIPSGPGFAVIDAPGSRWQGRHILGRMLAREEVLGSQVTEELFRITDVIYERDPRFRAFWESTTH